MGGTQRVAGKVALIVNVASQCGYTAQYAGLVEMSTKFKDAGLNVIAFPCNQFGCAARAFL